MSILDAIKTAVVGTKGTRKIINPNPSGLYPTRYPSGDSPFNSNPEPPPYSSGNNRAFVEDGELRTSESDALANQMQPNDFPFRGATNLPVGQQLTDYDGKRDTFKGIKPSVFGSSEDKQKAYSVITVLFDTAQNTPKEYAIQGNVIFFVSSTNVTDVLNIRFDDQSADPIPLLPGVAFNAWSFQRIWLSWDTILNATGYLFVGYDPSAKLKIT